MNTSQDSIINIKIILVLIFIFGGITRITKAQVVYEHISNTGIYDYLDEMANLNVVELNNVIKPYSREYIYTKLTEIVRYNELRADNLNKRQLKDLAFYQTAYALEADVSLPFPAKTDLIKKSTGFATALNPVGLFYKDSVFSMALQPILGASFSSNANGSLSHTWGGAALFGYIGKNLGFYTNVRDNNESRLMIAPDYLQRQQGVPVKNFGDKGVDYTEARGGITYAWKWGTVGLVKDHVEWGLGYNGTNIQSGRTPSFAMIKLQLKPVRWFEFNYYHGTLVSEVIDSARSYMTNNTHRVVYFQKYMAANMFTFYPVKQLNFSFGNSIVYTNESGGGPHAAYLIPFLFYKSVDLTLSANDKGGYSGNNNQFFFNISSRNIRHLHLYFSLFADDISFSYLKDKDLYNSFSYKLGFRLSGLPVQNLTLTAEYTLTNPYVYQHHAETQNYTSNSYNMGHYLRDNAREYYFALKYIPVRGLAFELAYTLAQHGDDYNINDPGAQVHSDPVLNNIIWQNQQLQFNTRYEIVSNTWVFASFNYQNITGQQDKIEKFTPAYYWGTTGTVNAGLCIGF
ncbi:MAG: hypothetical protein HOO86_15410 [Bacteroidales bacterium]|nr:hypothetical protein [Bacteroidales bacterium]